MSSSPADARAGGGAPPAAPFTFLDMPCDLVSCLGPVASTPGYAREMDGTQCLCRAARDDTMLGAATADLRYEEKGKGRLSRLQHACKMNNEARVSWLLECGALDVVNAARYLSYKGGAALVRRLAADPRVDATEALVAAAFVGATNLIPLLLARSAQVDGAAAVGIHIFTALDAASVYGQREMVAALVAAGAGVITVDVDGTTALMLAASKGHLEIVQALVAVGADVNMRDVDGCSAAAHAIAKGHEAVAAYLCRLPQADPSAHIVAAVWLGDVVLVRRFIARGARVEERDKSGATCLGLAAKRGHAKVVRALLEAGANVAAVNEETGISVLSEAVDKPVIVKLLLERFEVREEGEEEEEGEGEGVGLRQHQLNFALYLAVARGTPEGEKSARLLKAAGAAEIWRRE